MGKVTDKYAEDCQDTIGRALNQPEQAIAYIDEIKSLQDKLSKEGVFMTYLITVKYD